MATESVLRAIIALQNHIVASGLSLDAVMATLARELPKLLRHSTGAVIELRNGDFMEYRAGSGSAASSVGLRLPMVGSLSGLCATTRQALYARDIENDDRVDTAACRALGIRSMICYPLFADDVCVGVCKSFAAVPDAFDDSDLDTLEAVSSVIAASLRHAMLFEDAITASRADALTGLGNRRAFDDEAAGLVARARREDEPLTMMVVDLDDFKPINDTFGHGAGDAALITFGKALAMTLRGTDRAYRLGGDEFCVLFAGATLADADTLLARIRTVLHLDTTQCPLHFSAGFAQLTATDDVTTLLRRADRVMYEQKRKTKALAERRTGYAS